MKSVSVASRK